MVTSRSPDHLTSGETAYELRENAPTGKPGHLHRQSIQPPPRTGSVISFPGGGPKDPRGRPDTTVAQDQIPERGTHQAMEGRVVTPMRVDLNSSIPAIDHQSVTRNNVVYKHHHQRSSSLYKPYRTAGGLVGIALSPVEDVEVQSAAEENSPQPITREASNRGQQRSSISQIATPSNTSPLSSRHPLMSNPVEEPGTRGPLPELPSSKQVRHALLPVKTNSPNNFPQHKIVRTPYPTFSGSPSSPFLPMSARVPRPCVLYLRLDGHNNNPSKFASVIIPGRRRLGILAHHESRSQQGMSIFDDEQLFQLLRKEYRKLRHPLQRLISLRTLQSLDLLYTSPGSLNGAAETRSIGLTQFKSPHLTPATMMNRFRKPARARGAYIWTDWLHDLSLELSGSSVDGPARVTVEFKEGWSVTKLLLLVAVKWLVSAGAGIVWVIIGIDAARQQGLKRAGARVQTGILLSGVLLLLGWSLLGAWAVLSWLIM